MSFPFKILKTIQAIGVLLRFDGVKRMNYMRLLKLLYIADRESLRETGRPITGGPVIAMERGPVLKEVYDLILGQHREMSLWSQFYRKERYDLLELAEPDVPQLGVRKPARVTQSSISDARILVVEDNLVNREVM